MRNKQVKRKTTLPKIRRDSPGRLKGTEPSAGGTAEHTIGASQADGHCDGQRGRDVENQRRTGLTATTSKAFVPVVDKENNPLMPTTCSRARKWIKSGKATGFWKRGIYCVRLNIEPSDNKTQEIVVGIDPGSKREGFTVKSEVHTFLNIEAETVDWVSDHVEVRKNLRKVRRYRTTPCRKNRSNRLANKTKLPPSTKSRWQWKLRIVNWISKLFPITDFIVEDIKAITLKGKRKWNKSFSPLEVGKTWFYNELKKLGNLYLKQGYETKLLRESIGLKKSGNKLSGKFETHCIDSWVLANYVVGGHINPDNTNILHIKPLKFHRRQLHMQNPSKGGLRKNYGGSLSMGFKRGSLAVHPKYGLCYIGGTSKNRISLHDVRNGNRLTQSANTKEIRFLTYNSFIIKQRDGNSSNG